MKRLCVSACLSVRMRDFVCASIGHKIKVEVEEEEELVLF